MGKMAALISGCVHDGFTFVQWEEVVNTGSQVCFAAARD